MQINLCLTKTKIRINSAKQYTDLDYATFCMKYQTPRLTRLSFYLFIFFFELQFWENLVFVELKELLVHLWVPAMKKRQCLQQ